MNFRETAVGYIFFFSLSFDIIIGCPVLIAYLTGFNLIDIFIGWYAVGLYAAAFWPMWYEENMRKEDWISYAKGAPFLALYGPFAYLLGFPL